MLLSGLESWKVFWICCYKWLYSSNATRIKNSSPSGTWNPPNVCPQPWSWRSRSQVANCSPDLAIGIGPSHTIMQPEGWTPGPNKYLDFSTLVKWLGNREFERFDIMLVPICVGKELSRILVDGMYATECMYTTMKTARLAAKAAAKLPLRSMFPPLFCCWHSCLSVSILYLSNFSTYIRDRI